MTAQRFFTVGEAEIVGLLADLIIPRDERSGSASDAGVPDYIDYAMAEADAATRARMRLGLAWINAQSRRDFGTSFAACDESARHALASSIAWSRPDGDSRRAGAAFFAWFRQLTADGFWTSEIGYADLGFAAEAGDSTVSSSPQA